MQKTTERIGGINNSKVSVIGAQHSKNDDSSVLAYLTGVSEADSVERADCMVKRDERQLKHHSELPALPGQRLLCARERAGLTEQEVAKHLKLPKRYIDAIELDDYGRLPGASYARGYIRNYCRLLGIPSGEIVELFNSLVAESDIYLETAAAVEPSSFLQVWRTINLQWHLYALASLAVLLLVLAFWPNSESPAALSLSELEATQLFVDQLPDETKVSVEQSVLAQLPRFKSDTSVFPEPLSQPDMVILNDRMDPAQLSIDIVDRAF